LISLNLTTLVEAGGDAAIDVVDGLVANWDHADMWL